MLVALSVLSLFVKTGYACLLNPVDVFSCYGMWIHNLIAGITGTGDVIAPEELLAHNTAYYIIVNRVPITLLTIICGGILAIAGSLYQSAFRNPIASPSMLGVSSAIQFGDMLLVLFFGVVALV